jgi:hypothetical protein
MELKGSLPRRQGHATSLSQSSIKKKLWPHSASELYRSRDRRLSVKLVPTFVDRGCHVISARDPYGRIIGFQDRPNRTKNELSESCPKCLQLFKPTVSAPAHRVWWNPRKQAYEYIVTLGSHRKRECERQASTKLTNLIQRGRWYLISFNGVPRCSGYTASINRIIINDGFRKTMPRS